MNSLRKPPTDLEVKGPCRYDIEGRNVSVQAYPRKYESRHFLRNTLTVLVRPIKKEDACLLVDCFESLSPRTVFLRFLTNIQTLPLEWVRQFTDIDYARDVAMVAVEESDLRNRIIGVCRIMRKHGSVKGEIAVVVGDAWQEKGIGTLLLERSIQIARELGMRTLWGLTSCENTRVIEMAEKYGFRLKEASESGHCELEMEL